MASGVSVSVEGLDRLQADLSRVGRQVADSAREAVEEAGEAVRQDTQSSVRVDTGALRDGVEVRTVADGLGAEVGWTDPDLFYAEFQEFGTSKIPANPALTAAGEAERGKFGDRIADRVKQAIG